MAAGRGWLLPVNRPDFGSNPSGMQTRKEKATRTCSTAIKCGSPMEASATGDHLGEARRRKRQSRRFRGSTDAVFPFATSAKVQPIVRHLGDLSTLHGERRTHAGCARVKGPFGCLNTHATASHGERSGHHGVLRKRAVCGRVFSSVNPSPLSSW